MIKILKNISNILVALIFSNTGLAEIEPVLNLQESQPNVFALKNARIQINPDKLIENAHIIIRGERVENVGVNINIPLDAYEIDMTGKTIYPGFIDAWFEVATPDSNPSQIAHWNSKVHPDFSTINSKYITKSDQNNFHKNGITAVHIVPNEGIFRGLSSVKLLNSKQTILYIKPTQVMAFETHGWYSNQYPGSLLGSIALMRQTFYDALWYKRAIETYNNFSEKNDPVELNNALESLKIHLNKNGSFLFKTGDEISTLRAFNISNEFNLNIWIKSKGYEYRRLNEFKKLNSFFILPINFESVPNVSNHRDALNYSTEKLKHWVMAPKNPGILANNNIHFAFTMDGLKKKSDFRKNLILMIKKHGLKKRSALKALTISPAKKLGLQDKIGQIKTGFIANLIITNGDYFDSHSKIEAVWIGGEEKKLKQNNFDLFRGDWEFFNKEFSGELHISKNNGKFKINGIDIQIENLKFSKNQISFTSKLDSIGFNGITQFVGHLLKNKLNGTLNYKNGNSISWQAVKKNSKDDTHQKIIKNKQYDIPTVFPEGAFGLEKLHSTPQIVVVKNATIWTSSDKGILYETDLLVRNGLIHNINKNIIPPKNAVVVNARGKHITPGLIDCHSHSAASAINEGTQSITSEVRIKDVLDSDDIAIYRELAGGLTMVNILHGSANTIGGQNAVIKLKWGENPEKLLYKNAPEGIKFALGENVKQSNWGDNHTTRYPQTRMGVEQVLRDAFERASEYRLIWENYNQKVKNNIEIDLIPPRRDLELDALVEVLIGDRKIHCHSYRQDEILMLTRVAEDYGFTIGTFQHVLEGFKVADRLVEHGAGASTFSDWWAYKYEVIDAIPYNGALMHNVGVNVSFNSDSDELARRMNLEAAKAIKYGGVSEQEALKFVTINPAIQLGVDQWVGSLEIGKEADFVVWSGHPLSTMTKCEQTWIDGIQYFSIEEDKKLRIRDKRWRNEIIQYILQNADSSTKNYLKPDTGQPHHNHRCMEGVER